MARVYAELTALMDLGDEPGWDFGGYPYGLEPLTLPYPAHEDVHDDQPSTATLALACWRVADQLQSLRQAAVPPPESPEKLDRFRWITGHQISFIAWRMAAQLLAEIDRGRQPTAATVAEISTYVDVYSAMLIYSGSCTSRRYHDHIRPSMQLHHPGFSGSWAPDYVPIRHLLRGRLEPLHQAPNSDQLRHAVDVNIAVHEWIAEKLVPDGVSLLRGTSQSAVHQGARLLNQLYDNYFMTNRGETSRSGITAQLLRRVSAVVQDIQANGLTTDQEIAELPVDLRACARATCSILLDASRRSVGRPALVGLQLARRHQAMGRTPARQL